MHWLETTSGPAWPFLLLGIAAGTAALIHLALFALFALLARRSGLAGWCNAVRCLRWPSFWIVLTIVAGVTIRGLALPRDFVRIWDVLGGLLLPAMFGWLAYGMLRLGRGVVEARADISVANNLQARRRRTRVGILSRIATFIILFVTIAMMLLSIPSIRSVGVTLMASAGLVALAVGAAAQPALKNLIAGIQMAFTEPIRLDDVVIVEGEWGRIEEIRLTYVVVAIWDQRRLVVPISKFLEEPFQNWTRSTSQLLGTVFLHLDPCADVARLRRKFAALLAGNDKWDRRVGVVQVTDSSSDAIEVRLLLSAADAGTAFDLRCEIREAMLAFVRDEMPEALPHRREILSGAVATREAA